MHILITGATGLIGRALTQRLLSLSHQITVLSRDPRKAFDVLGKQITCWSTLNDQQDLNNIDAVINLAGEPIADKRWTVQQKERLCQSRWQITQQLAELINVSSNPPDVFISGSAVGFYGDKEQVLVTEEEPPHDEFTHQLCARWEQLASTAESSQTRVCLLRTGVVLAAKGGALAKMLPLFRLCLGGPMGNGRQYFPWIHIDDMVNAIHYLLTNDTLCGPYNMVSPSSVCNGQFSAILAKILHRPAFLRAPASIIRLLMGESAVLVLGSQHAVPKRLEEAGFNFHHCDLEGALRDVLRNVP
ncbi:TIGR01777 family oxidoreductase [Candidatus Fukatsuia symbiotica]|uniref:TIGR01777 family protein n=1 Tax=Candidatus Fukatsuia symbiotica TaxID=1878942 RepID=A0A2U8I6I0_9GAMM|nr:TIGR01777 family oxidoreductase [Candidatus Fukatsuia symbiotica]AWK14669.1 TIGR01777 family protein [Candidatus Fukatsuia symbiotica]MEA9444986.1 TIGR01777 family oxidoreductase [Candidatus Fukatsuia symbiotica]